MLPLLPHQIEGVKRILEDDSILVADDMGLGKTRTVIEAIVQRNKWPILIVCPASLKLNWQAELLRWANITTSIDDVSQDIVIINYESMHKHSHAIKKRKFKQLVFDESHCLKNEKSIRGRLALEWARTIPYRICISGTPILNRPLELLNQIAIIHRLDVFGGRDKYVNDFCGKRVTRYGETTLGFKNTEKLNKLLKKIMLRRTKDDLETKLPTKTIEYVALCDVPQDSPHSLVGIERLDRVVLSRKTPAAISFIENVLERGEQLVVFVHHKKLLERLMDKFKDVAVTIHGGQSATARQESVDLFQNGEKQLIICSLLASAVGITLTAAHLAVFIEYPWTPSLYAQAQDRIHRLSQTLPVTIYCLYATNSIDEYRMTTTKAKSIIIDKIIQ